MTTLASITCATAGTIATFALGDASCTLVATSPVGEGVSALAISADGLRGWAKVKEPAPAVVGLELDPAAGTWREVSRTPTESDLTYLTVSGCGRWLLGASYAGGHAMVWPLDGGPDGRFGDPTARVEFARLHCVVERDGFVYLVSLGEDVVVGYRLTDDGELTPLGTPTFPAPRGCGPRHLVLSDDGAHAYVMTEFSGEVLHYARDPETGELAQVARTAAYAQGRGLRHSRLGADPLAEHLIWGADLNLAGGFLLASERTESTLAVLPVAADGSLGQPVCFAETERQPRGFAVAPVAAHEDVAGSSWFVVSPGEKSDHVALFVLDARGQLSRAAREPIDGGGNWVRLLARR